MLLDPGWIRARCLADDRPRRAPGIQRLRRRSGRHTPRTALALPGLLHQRAGPLGRRARPAAARPAAAGPADPPVAAAAAADLPRHHPCTTCSALQGRRGAPAAPASSSPPGSSPRQVDAAAGHRAGHRAHVDPRWAQITGSGDLWSTAGDLLRCSRALRCGQLLDSGTDLVVLSEDEVPGTDPALRRAPLPWTPSRLGNGRHRRAQASSPPPAPRSSRPRVLATRAHGADRARRLTSTRQVATNAPPGPTTPPGARLTPCWYPTRVSSSRRAPACSTGRGRCRRR